MIISGLLVHHYVLMFYLCVPFLFGDYASTTQSWINKFKVNMYFPTPEMFLIWLDCIWCNDVLGNVLYQLFSKWAEPTLGGDFERQGMNKTMGGQTTQREQNCSTMLVLSFPTSYSVEKGFLAMTLMLSKQISRFLIHKHCDLWVCLTKMSPSIWKLC